MILFKRTLLRRNAFCQRHSSGRGGLNEGISKVSANHSSEALFSFDAESGEEVDEIAKKVEEAGGTVFSKPAEVQGWIYGCAFTGLEGHRWNVLYMDTSKVPKE